MIKVRLKKQSLMTIFCAVVGLLTISLEARPIKAHRHGQKFQESRQSTYEEFRALWQDCFAQLNDKSFKDGVIECGRDEDSQRLYEFLSKNQKHLKLGGEQVRYLELRPEGKVSQDQADYWKLYRVGDLRCQVSVHDGSLDVQEIKARVESFQITHAQATRQIAQVQTEVKKQQAQYTCFIEKI